MESFLRQAYLKEEEFLADFSDVAYAAAKLLRGEWQPDASCDDDTRELRDAILKTGKLDDLTFRSAIVYGDADRSFSSAHVTLKSSHRVVNVRVRKMDGDFMADTILDRPAEQP